MSGAREADPGHQNIRNEGTSMNCKYCGAELEADAKFCPECGKAQTEEDVPAAETEQAAPETAAQAEEAAPQTDEAAEARCV